MVVLRAIVTLTAPKECVKGPGTLLKIPLCLPRTSRRLASYRLSLNLSSL
jgi:hypothetical protein